MKNKKTEHVAQPVENEVDEGQENMTNEQLEENSDAGVNDNVTDWEAKYKDVYDSYIRLNAEFDNYRKRTLKEKADLIKSGTERVLVDIVGVIDDVDRAIDTIEKSDDIASIKEGIGLIHSKFVSLLSKYGVKEIETVGCLFDVDKHEALTTVPTDKEEDKDKIIDCVQKGYMLDDKIIRYPKVIVAK